MVRTAIVDDNLLKYISAVSKEHEYAIGLILGQSCLGKDYIIHFAKTPPFQSEEDKKLNKPIIPPNSIEDFNVGLLADHAKQATRMLLGGIYVLGIFVVSPEDILNPFNPKIKSMLVTVYHLLSSDKYSYGNPNSEKLVFHHSSKTQKYYCRSYDVCTHNVQPVDVKPLQKKWVNVHCDFQLNKLRYFSKEQGDWPLEQHIKIIMDEICKELESAVFLFDGEFKDKDDSLETLGKKKNRSKSNKSLHDSGDSSKPLTVTMFQTQNSSISLEENIIEACGRLKLIGKVSSKLWLQPKLTIYEASTVIKEDILRSLSSRLEMHWDSLLEEENSEATNSIHEPPRRVLIFIPDSEVAFCDYLFPGEGPQDAKVSLEELLDVKVKGKLNIKDVEGQADPLEIDKYYKGSFDCDKIDILPNVTSASNSLMYVGLLLSLLILVVAILFKFFM